MGQYYTKWSNRRTASGKWKPFIYFLLEIIALAMFCWLVSLFHILIVTLVVILGAIYIFITSSLPRYRKVYKRQKYSMYD
jgi:uncharacterized membrane protein YbaN (DUF454 family)